MQAISGGNGLLIQSPMCIRLQTLKRIWPILWMLANKPKTVNVNKDVEKLQPLWIVGIIVKYSCYCGKQYEDSSNFEYLFVKERSLTASPGSLCSPSWHSSCGSCGVISVPYHFHQIPQKLKNRAVIQSVNQTYIYSRNEISVSRNIRTPISIAELFTVAQDLDKENMVETCKEMLCDLLESRGILSLTTAT